MADTYIAKNSIKWNRKIYMYMGLYMVLFLWVFAVLELLVNHPDWLAGQPHRRTTDHVVIMLESGANLKKVQHIMGQVGLRAGIVFKGEQKPGKFSFIALRPNMRMFVTVDLATSNAWLMPVTPKHPLLGMLNGLHVYRCTGDFWGVRGCA